MGGNDALAGALAASGAEAVAPIVSKWLYGKEAKDLTAEEKATISTIAGMVKAATGTVAGGSMADVAQGNQAGHTAVDNNQLAINHNLSNKMAYEKFNKKVKKELGNKFELKGTGKLNALGYEIMELVPIGNNTIDTLSKSELQFYNMLNNVIKDTTGTAQIIFVYDDDSISGGSWKYNKFDVADMEKLDKNHIIISGNVLIAHEFNEQIEKNKLGLNPNEMGKPIDSLNSHEKAIDHEKEVLPSDIGYSMTEYMINGKVYQKIYADRNTGNIIGVNLTTDYTQNGQNFQKFEPTQDIIKPNLKNGKFLIYKRGNPNPLIF